MALLAIFRRAAGAFALASAMSAAAWAAAPAPTPVTPALVEAAKAEGKVVFYTAIDLTVVGKIAKALATDPAAQERESEEIKKKYADYFGI